MSTVNAKVFRYPSEELRPFPAFEIRCPSTWAADEAPECIVALYDTEAAEAFRTNLVIGADRLDDDVELADLADAALDDAEESFTGFALEDERVVDVGGQPASLRFQTFEMEGHDQELFQMQLLFFAPQRGRSTKDLFRIHATCLSDEAEKYADVFVDIAQSFRFAGGLDGFSANGADG
ncbi:MAG: DcrB-related protein [Actinomycetota bacterium]|nr:DcrB-related protein [Actinomycetota bacterium]